MADGYIFLCWSVNTSAWQATKYFVLHPPIISLVELIGFVLCADGISYALRRGYVYKLLAEYTFLSRYHIKTDRVPFQAPRIASDQSKYAFPGFLLLS